jgi:Flp pilus assembly protein CpaB
MDPNTILSISAIVVSTAASILAVVNHKRIRSNCCGAKLEASLDVESTTPPNAEKNPTNTVVNV